MAERRMFAKTIIDSDNFLDMPLSAQALYFHLSMRGDDEGFINNPNKIQRMIGASHDDFKLLIAKQFIIPFESGIVVVRHWHIHNYIQKDRKKDTVYQEERKELQIEKNGMYTRLDTRCIQNDDNPDSQYSIVKDSIDKYSLVECSIVEGSPEQDTTADKAADTPGKLPGTTTGGRGKPSFREVAEYIDSRGGLIDARKFYDYYEERNFRQKGGKPLDWKKAVEFWEGTERKRKSNKADGGFEEKSFETDDMFQAALERSYGSDFLEENK